jgi:NACalpha-BTF3-like transcription factor
MQKLGMKPVAGVQRVTIKKSKNVRSLAAGLGQHACLPQRCNVTGRSVYSQQQLACGCTNRPAMRSVAHTCQLPHPSAHRERLRQEARVYVQIMFVIAKPDVLHNPNSDTYVIFGEAKIEDYGAQAQAQAAQSFVNQKAPAPPQATIARGAGAADDDANVDAEGIEEKDIDLVMNQASVSRGKAITALKGTGGDIVSAIMELTVS